MVRAGPGKDRAYTRGGGAQSHCPAHPPPIRPALCSSSGSPRLALIGCSDNHGEGGTPAPRRMRSGCQKMTHCFLSQSSLVSEREGVRRRRGEWQEAAFYILKRKCNENAVKTSFVSAPPSSFKQCDTYKIDGFIILTFIMELVSRWFLLTKCFFNQFRVLS